MSLKIIFMGTPTFAVPILKSVNESKHKILCVFSQPPRKKDRGQKEIISPIQEYSQKAKIECMHPETLDDNVCDFIKGLNPDLILVVAYGKIIPAKLLNLQNIKFINIHASLLPKWRGAAPIQRALMNLDKETGISIMQITSKLDAGPVMMTSKIKISKESNYETLSDEISKLGAKKILEALEQIQNKKAKFIPQLEAGVSYASKIEKKEAKINWSEKAEKVIGKIKALHPNPGCWLELNGARIKIIKAIETQDQGKPGEIINQNFTVACSSNSIKILELKKEGKQKMKVSEFLKGNSLKLGLILN